MGLERSQQWIMFCRTWTLVTPPRPCPAHLYPVAVVVEQEDAAARHLLGLHHGLQVGQQTHVLAHVSSQHLGTNITTSTDNCWFKMMCRGFPIPLPAYHVDDHLAEGLSLFLGQVDEDITVEVLQQLEGDGQVVVL